MSNRYMRSLKNRSCLLWLLLLIGIVALIALTYYIPILAEVNFGPPSPFLSYWQRFGYAVSLLAGANNLIIPVDPYGSEQVFTIEPGEAIASISNRLEQNDLIHDADIFRVYLVYSGKDTSVQSGVYHLSPALSALQIAQTLQDASPSEVAFSILAGWRMEEVAASLPTSGLNISPDQFMANVQSPVSGLNLFPSGASAEGFLFPEMYVLSRQTTAEELVSVLLQEFTNNTTFDLMEGFSRQGLDLYDAVILASIVEREAVVDEEKPMIASVFLNRLAIGMRLESDPTVQYALGFNEAQGTWWTNPLSYDDLYVVSPYNTFLNQGLPPAPICNPGLSSLQAVAYPAQTPYYFFRARCDGSGLHSFAETLEQHHQNACP